MSREQVLILDFGSQFTQLIARRIRELGVYTEILPPRVPLPELLARAPRALVLSGGPDSVYAEGAPRADPALLGAGIPVLGICYGMQWMMRELGGQVRGAERREYGPAEVSVEDESIFRGLASRQSVWMSHGDHTVRLPAGFRTLAHSENAPCAAAEDPIRRLVAVQFHPEVAHTRHGTEMLRAFLYDVCGCRGDWTMGGFLEEQVAAIRQQVGEDRVLAGLSGGVDSSVLALLLHEALGERLVPLFIDNGLLRRGEPEQVMDGFARSFRIRVHHRDASEEFLAALSGVEDPEEKRRRVGETFVRVFEREAAALGGARFLAQGTLYPDVIESRSVGGPSATIKTHHNVGGLPERMSLELVEPFRLLFKDEVRRLGAQLGLAPELLGRHPFPGPGLAVRILGEVTAERCTVLRHADAIYLEELHRTGWYERCAQAFAVLLPVRTVGVMGDARTYDRVVALRAVTSDDFMTADWARLPEALLARTAARIVNEVRGVNRVVYDVTSKPPATIEWE